MRFIGFSLAASLATMATAYPGQEYRSLAGMSEKDIDEFSRRSTIVGALPPPPPLKDDSSKLVYDAKHPYKAPGKHDIRGPCPGLNTLANHGYLPRSGIASPQQIVDAVQKGFNMGNGLATFVAWGAFLVDGNHLTNLMSIGEKSPATGPDPPAPAIVGGLNTHGVFEGDASTTRGDAEFGDNHTFNETLFQVFIDGSNKYGGGKYNLAAAAEIRWARIQDSLARNPNFNFETPRIVTAYAESSFPLRFFVDGRKQNDSAPSLELDAARLFFQTNKFPHDFYRRNGSSDRGNYVGDDIDFMAAKHVIHTGHNEGAGNYVETPEDLGLAAGDCGIYTKHVNVTLPSLYPNPKGRLLKALKTNMATFYSIVALEGCPQVFPYGH